LDVVLLVLPHKSGADMAPMTIHYRLNINLAFTLAGDHIAAGSKPQSHPCSKYPRSGYRISGSELKHAKNEPEWVSCVEFRALELSKGTPMQDDVSGCRCMNLST